MTNILFICVYNSGRSQMAEAFVNALRHNDIRAFSAGISKHEGVLPNVVLAMKEIGISMRGHYPKLLTSQMLEEADIIVATCDEVCVALPKKIEATKHILKWRLPSPAGPIGEVRKIRDEIKQKVDELIATIRKESAKAYFAGGCFWGVEYFFRQAEGVISVRSGYMGGTKKNPTYEEVSSGITGHLETIEVVYDSQKTNFEKLAKLFFEIHDPTQVNRQGPDIGEQYQSAIFYIDKNQKTIAENFIAILKKKGYIAGTKLIKASDFWPAEEYHQNYYGKTGKTPYCHVYTKRS